MVEQLTGSQLLTALPAEGRGYLWGEDSKTSIASHGEKTLRLALHHMGRILLNLLIQLHAAL